MKKFKDFFEAFHFCNNHPFFNSSALSNSMCIDVVKTNGKGRICKDHSKNIVTEVWIEWGPICGSEGKLWARHDIDLDTGGRTYEEAIINLANLIMKKYGIVKNEEIVKIGILALSCGKVPDFDFSKRGWVKVLKEAKGRLLKKYWESNK